MAVNVNNILREKVEKNDYDYVIYDHDDFRRNVFESYFSSLAKNETKVDMLLDELWYQFGIFTELKSSEKFEMIMDQKIYKEVITFENVSSLDYYDYYDYYRYTTENQCLENETCWSNVEKMSRSVAALSRVANEPKYFGNYLSYHVNRLFKKESFIQPDTIGSHWFSSFYLDKLDEHELAFNEILMNMTFALSGGKLKNVSLLDLPAFGSTLDSFDASNEFNYWPIQLNMEIYNRLMRSNNNTWSKNFAIDNIFTFKALTDRWNLYMNDFKASDFPPSLQNNTLFNFTNHIKEDMSTFLAAYAMSFPNLSRNTSIWSKIAKTLSIETHSEKEVRTYGKYDKLVIDCVFQEPLMSHKFDVDNGCTDFVPVLTDNGLCYSFNGIETSKVWSQTLRDSEILQSFSTVFGTTDEQTRNFSGIGHSQGK